jgi:DNA-binding phage protein
VIAMNDVFNTLLELEGRDPEFARAYAAESARIEAIDSIINALDEARGTEKLSKAALARAIGADPSTVRRLLSSESVNPTLSTIAEVAAALGMKVTLTPMSDDERTRITEPMRACA